MIYITEDFRSIETTEAIPLEKMQSFLVAAQVYRPRIVLAATASRLIHGTGELSGPLTNFVEPSRFLTKSPAGTILFVKTGFPVEKFLPDHSVLDFTTPAIARELILGWESLTPRAGSFDAWELEQAVKILTPIGNKKPRGNKYTSDIFG